MILLYSSNVNRIYCWTISSFIAFITLLYAHFNNFFFYSHSSISSSYRFEGERANFFSYLVFHYASMQFSSKHLLMNFFCWVLCRKFSSKKAVSPRTQNKIKFFKYLSCGWKNNISFLVCIFLSKEWIYKQRRKLLMGVS